MQRYRYVSSAINPHRTLLDYYHSLLSFHLLKTLVTVTLSSSSTLSFPTDVRSVGMDVISSSRSVTQPSPVSSRVNSSQGRQKLVIESSSSSTSRVVVTAAAAQKVGNLLLQKQSYRVSMIVVVAALEAQCSAAQCTRFPFSMSLFQFML